MVPIGPPSGSSLTDFQTAPEEPNTTRTRLGTDYVGAIVARRIGVEGLRDLCEHAAANGSRFVPTDRVLARPALGNDLRGWNAALRD